jgi:hypothetical protein
VCEKWTAVKGMKTDSEPVIYHLEAYKDQRVLFFVTPDDNVLFFRDRERNLMSEMVTSVMRSTGLTRLLTILVSGVRKRTL